MFHWIPDSIELSGQMENQAGDITLHVHFENPE